MAVRYDNKFMAEINKIVRSYNAKINRLGKISNDYVLPSKFTALNMRDLKATATSRAEVRRELKNLQSFTAKGGEKNITIGHTTVPKYLYNNVKRYQRLATYRINKKI